MADSPAHRPAQRPWPPQIDDGWPIPSPDEIAAAKMDNGYYDVESVRAWGVPVRADAHGRERPIGNWRPRMEALWRKANPRTWPERKWPPVAQRKFPTPSPDEIAAAKLETGYYDESKLAEWGIPQPAPDGWPRKMEALWRKEQAKAKAKRRRSRPWPPEEPDGWPFPSPEEIAAAKGANGYWPEDKLEEWGVPINPTPPNWKDLLERAFWRNNIPAEIIERLGDAYDEEGIRVAWRMFEAWWDDPEQVRKALRPPSTEIVLAHIDGPARIILKLPMDPTVAAAALEALGPLGWSAMGDSSLLFKDAEEA
jgi:hypothetical protein